MCVRVCVCMYVCMYACMYVCVYVCMYFCMYVCIYLCMYVFIHVFMYVHTYVFMYVCMYVFMYVRTYGWMCMYVCSPLKCDKGTLSLFRGAWTQNTLILIRLCAFHPIKSGNTLNKPPPSFYVLPISWSINFLLSTPHNLYDRQNAIKLTIRRENRISSKLKLV